MRYRVGWPIPGRVLALTHFSPDVTAEDYAGIMAATEAELRRAERPFHLLIDNRRLADETVAGLDDILAAAPPLRHEHLRWIVIVLQDSIKRRARDLPEQRRGTISLRYAETLDGALRHLAGADATLPPDGAALAFFEAAGRPA